MNGVKIPQGHVHQANIVLGLKAVRQAAQAGDAIAARKAAKLARGLVDSYIEYHLEQVKGK